MTKKYEIKIKRDFGKYGWYDAETRTCGRRDGFVVCQGMVNVIPGAMWFQTIADAMRGVRAHMISGDTMEWHDTYERLREEEMKRFFNGPRMIT